VTATRRLPGADTRAILYGSSGSPSRRMGWIGLAVLAILSATACERDQTPPPTTTCAKVAELCKLPDGPLGVCNSVACKPGQAPPCLRCTPQH
jgi:hypothetical protein